MFNTLDLHSNMMNGWMISFCFAPVLFSITLPLLFLPFLFRLYLEISQLSQAIWAAYHRVKLWVTTGRDEALSSSKKWYTIHVYPWIYIVVVACISFRREVRVNETHTHTDCMRDLNNYLNKYLSFSSIIHKLKLFLSF
jgi:hypothetical protein